MNDLLRTSFSGFKRHIDDDAIFVDIELSPATENVGGGVNLDKFFEDVEGIKDEFKELERVYQRLLQSHEESKTLHNAKSMKELRSRMDSDVSAALKKAKLIKVRLEALERANIENCRLPGCGPGSSSERTRSSVVSGLKKKMKESMDGFNRLREQMSREYRETVERRYYTVTGEKPEEQTVEVLISTGESEKFLQKAIEKQGRGQVLDIIGEIQERHDTVKEIARNLNELHQVFLDMAVLVDHQGEEIDDIERQVIRANSIVRSGTQQLQKAKNTQRNTRKWTLIGIILLLIVLLVILLPILLGK
ncbi:syntaxin-121-like [Macadamia integrifolia]|uniref:syntaxin-121-like n=1 Tax=Macadamia integrifolia TaxID=60698 RepID=UPI001C4E5728|nr:syntaxin-121-like [Macadamia integrifolia]